MEEEENVFVLNARRTWFAFAPLASRRAGATERWAWTALGTTWGASRSFAPLCTRRVAIVVPPPDLKNIPLSIWNGTRRGKTGQRIPNETSTDFLFRGLIGPHTRQSKLRTTKEDAVNVHLFKLSYDLYPSKQSIILVLYIFLNPLFYSCINGVTILGSNGQVLKKMIIFNGV
jgi:hypothetical protein